MLLGYCTGPNCRDQLEGIKAAGFDYVEINLSALWNMNVGERADLKCYLNGLRLPCRAANCALPEGYSLVDGDLDRLADYSRDALAIASGFGVRVLTVGSGGARRQAPGQSPEEAAKLYTRAMALLGRLGRERDIRIAIEPLNRQECDLVHTLQEGQAIAQAAGVGLTADVYHMALAGEGPEIYQKILPVHVHVCGRDRRVPRQEEVPFLQSHLTALKDTGYHGMVSVEAETPADFAPAAKGVVALLKKLA